MVGFNTYRYGFDHNALADLERMSRQFNTLFSGAESPSRSALPVNLWASDEEAVVTVEVPGIEAADIELEVEDQTLSIRVQPKPEATDGEHRFHRRERTHGQAARAIRLPYEVEGEQVTAQARQGMLTIRLPRRADTRPRKISINTK